MSKLTSKEGEEQNVHIEVPNSVLLKLQRAYSLHEELIEEINAKPIRVACPTRVSSDGYQVHVLRPDPLPDIPPKWVAIFNDCIYNLRSSLDVLLWALIERYGTGHEPEAAQLTFPICKTEEEGDKAFSTLLKLLPVRVVDAIRRVQPYHTTPPSSHFLAILAELNNTDKHRYPIWPGSQILGWELADGPLSFGKMDEANKDREGHIMYMHTIDEVAAGEPVLVMDMGLPVHLSGDEAFSFVQLGAELIIEPDGPVDIRGITEVSYCNVETVVLQILVAVANGAN